MIPADVDPSLCTGEPTLDRLDDGFSPPAREPAEMQPEAAAATPHPEAALPPKSPF